MRYQIKGIDQFQLVQTNKETIIFNIVVNSDFTETEKSKLIEKTQEKLGSNMLVEISVVEEIKPGINGKFSWIISEIKKQ